ncbi:hypothetical protein ACLKA7_015218 [Drosophila subpalustris]
MIRDRNCYTLLVLNQEWTKKDMDGHCRVCMGSESLRDMFNKEQLPKDELSIAEMLSDCVNAEISPDDNFSKKICSSCILDTQIAIRLKRRYEKNNQSIKLKQEILENDEFINSLECEDWTLIERDPKSSDGSSPASSSSLSMLDAHQHNR